MKKIFNYLIVATLVITGIFIFEDKVSALEEGFNLNYQTVATQVELSWQNDSNISSYTIDVREDGSYDNSSIYIDTNNEDEVINYEVPDLKANTKYYIQVSAQPKDGEPISSKTIEITTGDAIRFDYEARGVSLDFYWDKVEDASEYNIYKVNNFGENNYSQDNYKLIKTIKNDNNNNEFKYTLRQEYHDEAVYFLETVKNDNAKIKSKFIYVHMDCFLETDGTIDDNGDLYLEWDEHKDVINYEIYGYNDSIDNSTYYGKTTDRIYYIENLKPNIQYNFYVIANLENGKTIEYDAAPFKLNKKIFEENKMNISGVLNKNYNDNEQKQKLTIKYEGQTLTEGKHYNLSYKDNKNAGTATVSINGIGKYYGTINRTFTINKASNPIKVIAKNKKVKYKKLKKKKQVITSLNVTKAQGKVTYAKVSGNKRFKINKTTGKITVKKKTKKGTYYLKFKVTAAGNNNYKAASKTVTVKFKIK